MQHNLSRCFLYHYIIGNFKEISYDIKKEEPCSPSFAVWYKWYNFRKNCLIYKSIPYIHISMQRYDFLNTSRALFFIRWRIMTKATMKMIAITIALIIYSPLKVIPYNPKLAQTNSVVNTEFYFFTIVCYTVFAVSAKGISFLKGLLWVF